MPRKGENIYKRKDGRWEGRYIRSYDSEHKAKYAYVYGKTYSEVKRKLTEQRGNVQKVQPTKNKSSTYGELLDCWLHSMQLNTKESTQARYTHLIKTHIKPHLGAVQLSQLTTDVIEIFIEQQLTDGRLDNSGGLSPKTVTDILTIIKSTIEYARYKELPVICNLSKLSIKKKEKEMRVFTPSEQESLIGTLTNDMDHSKFGVLLSLYTGIRVGELCALQWEDFDLAHSKLKIRKTMQRIQDLGNGSVSKTKIVITEPKSQCSIREIPLPLFIVDVAKKFASKEDEFAQLISMILVSQDAGIPFYLNDSRENLVLWAAAVQRILPSRLAKKFMFNTYIGDHESMRSPRAREEGLNFHLIGVRPDANYFNYATECESNRQIVMDFIGGHMTQGVPPNSYAHAMAASIAFDCEEVDSFGDFVDAKGIVI